MHTQLAPLFLIAETPLHAGTGQGLGAIDQPIQREVHTGYPKIEGSSLKGALREAFEYAGGQAASGVDLDKVKLTFGPPPEEAGTNAFQGALSLPDASLLLFPVRSLRGVFAWVTSHDVLARLERRLKLAFALKHPDHTLSFSYPKVGAPKAGQCWCTTGSPLEIPGQKTLMLEAFTFQPIGQEEGAKGPAFPMVEIVETKNPKKELFKKPLGDFLHLMGLFKGDTYWKDRLCSQVVVLPNDDFAYFVRQATEVITRVRISAETGTAEGTGLFNEEYLPAESVLYTLAECQRTFRTAAEREKDPLTDATGIMDYFEAQLPPVFQLGANTTIGKGQMRPYLSRSFPINA